MKTAIIKINSKKALRLLGSNKRNRKISQRHVDFLARQMSEDKWLFDGAPIRVNGDGTLLDGQHRLHAVVQSDTEHEFVLVEGLSTDAQFTMDTGRGRSNADTLYMEGYTHSIATAAITTMAYRYALGSNDPYNNAQFRVSNQEVSDYAKRHKAVFDAAKFVSARPISGFGSKAIQGFIWFAGGEIDADHRDIFFERLYTGLDLKADMAEYHLRKRLMEHATASSARGKLDRRHQYAFIVKAWNKSLAGLPLGVLRLNKNEDVQRLDPDPDLD